MTLISTPEDLSAICRRLAEVAHAPSTCGATWNFTKKCASVGAVLRGEGLAMVDDIDLIAAIYDASIEPSGWSEVIKRIAEATKSVGGVLNIRLATEEHALALHNIDPFYANAYAQFWHKHDGLAPLFATLAPGALRAATLITQTDSFKASAFSNEFVRPQGHADAVCVGLLRTPKAVEYLLLPRSPNALCMEPEQWKLLESLAPHLKRPAAIQDLLARKAATSDSLGAVVAASGFAVFLLTGDCRVVFANAKAEDLVRRGMGLRYERGQLAAANPTLTHRLPVCARSRARRCGPRGPKAILAGQSSSAAAKIARRF
jgi:hypothetical protein